MKDVEYEVEEQVKRDLLQLQKLLQINEDVHVHIHVNVLDFRLDWTVDKQGNKYLLCRFTVESGLRRHLPLVHWELYDNESVIVSGDAKPHGRLAIRPPRVPQSMRIRFLVS